MPGLCLPHSTTRFWTHRPAVGRQHLPTKEQYAGRRIAPGSERGQAARVTGATTVPRRELEGAVPPVSGGVPDARDGRLTASSAPVFVRFAFGCHTELVCNLCANSAERSAISAISLSFPLKTQLHRHWPFASGAKGRWFESTRAHQPSGTPPPRRPYYHRRIPATFGRAARQSCLRKARHNREIGG